MTYHKPSGDSHVLPSINVKLRFAHGPTTTCFIITEYRGVVPTATLCAHGPGRTPTDRCRLQTPYRWDRGATAASLETQSTFQNSGVRIGIVTRSPVIPIYEYPLLPSELSPFRQTRVAVYKGRGEILDRIPDVVFVLPHWVPDALTLSIQDGRGNRKKENKDASLKRRAGVGRSHGSKGMKFVRRGTSYKCARKPAH